MGYRLCLLLSLTFLLSICNTGCGGHAQPDCTVVLALDVAPQTATADHLAAPPGNKISFVGANSVVPGCIPTPGPIRLDLHWSVSDSANVTIGNTANVDYSVATCVHATPSPATVTATGTNRLGATISGTAALTCN